MPLRGETGTKLQLFFPIFRKMIPAASAWGQAPWRPIRDGICCLTYKSLPRLFHGVRVSGVE